MNYLVDVIIVGDSTTGHKLLDTIATNKPSIKLAFISQTFKSTTTHDYINVKYSKQEVEYVSYRNRLFCCYLANKDCIFGTHIILAPGVNYEPLVINNEMVPNVFNTINDIPKASKDQPAIVIYNQASDAKLALDIAKKYKQVYLCSKEIDMTSCITKSIAKKLADTENIAMLPNTSIKTIVSENGALQKVELDNYSTINCSAIYIKTKAKPAIDFIPKKIIPRDAQGYLTVSDKAESTLVPKCFAVGNCVQKYTKSMEQKLVETILKDF